MLNHTRRRVSRILAVPVATVIAMLPGYDVSASPADDLPPPSEPLLAEPDDWAADFNEAQVACYNGSMGACDSIWLSDRVLLDTFLHKYGRSCGGRVDHDTLRRAGAFRIGGPRMHCTDIFPGHE